MTTSDNFDVLPTGYDNKEVLMRTFDMLIGFSKKNKKKIYNGFWEEGTSYKKYTTKEICEYVWEHSNKAREKFKDKAALFSVLAKNAKFKQKCIEQMVNKIENKK